MKVLVLSDSHSSLYFMRACIRLLKPDCIIHLGDHADDAQVLHEENPQLEFYSIRGNCDGFYPADPAKSAITCAPGGVPLLITHGHRFYVKSGTEALVAYGCKLGVRGILFGHTHEAVCCHLDGDVWLMNPGAAGYRGGSAGILEIHDKKITACRIIGQADL